MNFLENFKAEFKKQAERQNTLDPSSPEARKRARLGGMGVFLIGLALCLGSLWSWNSLGSVPVIVLAAGPVLVLFGLYGMVVGRFPVKK